MKYEVSLPDLQESGSGPCLQPHESRLHLSILYSFTIHFSIILKSTCISSKGSFPSGHRTDYSSFPYMPHAPSVLLSWFYIWKIKFNWHLYSI